MPSSRRWCSKATTGASVGMSGVARRISAPSTTCLRMTTNSSSVSRPGLFSTSSGVLTLPMSCISAASPNSRSSEPSIAQRARLAHRQDRDVHHVGERVVVVVLQRRQREQRGPVLRHRLGEAVDHRARGRSGPAVPPSWRCPRPLRPPMTAWLYSRLKVAMSVASLSTRSSTVTRPTRTCLSAGNGGGAPRPSSPPSSSRRRPASRSLRRSRRDRW